MWVFVCVCVCPHVCVYVCVCVCVCVCVQADMIVLIYMCAMWLLSSVARLYHQLCKFLLNTHNMGKSKILSNVCSVIFYYVFNIFSGFSLQFIMIRLKFEIISKSGFTKKIQNDIHFCKAF